MGSSFFVNIPICYLLVWVANGDIQRRVTAEELATWEDEDDIPCGEVDFVAQYEAAQEALEAGETAATGSDGGSEDEL